MAKYFAGWLGYYTSTSITYNVPESSDGKFVNKDPTPRKSNANEHVVETEEDEEEEEDPGGTTDFKQVTEEDKHKDDCDDKDLWYINESKVNVGFGK